MTRREKLLFGLLAAVAAFYAFGRVGMNSLIKRFEGFSDTPYKDVAGIPTIGWGHKILPGESFTRITTTEAEQLLVKDTATATHAVNSSVVVPLSASQRDALISLAYNIGAGNFKNSTLLRKLNTGDYAGAAAEFDRWKYITVGGKKVVSNGLVARRNEEKRLFLA